MVLLVGIVNLVFLLVGWFLRGFKKLDVKKIKDRVKDKINNLKPKDAEVMEWQPPKEVDEEKQREMLKHNLQKK